MLKLFAVPCKVIPHPKYGTVVFKPDQPFSDGYAHFYCNGGYILSGVNPLTCGRDGTWGGKPPVCNPGNILLKSFHIRSQRTALIK